MAAVIFDLFFDLDRDNTINIIWFDDSGDPNDLTGFGAIFEIVDADNASVFRVDDEGTEITIFQPGDPEDPDEGRIRVIVHPTENNNPPYRYELVVFPTSGNPTVDPTSLMKGLAKMRVSHATLEPS